MNTLKRKYNCDHSIIASDKNCGVSLEKLITKISDDNVAIPTNISNKPSSKKGLVRSISMVAEHGQLRNQGRGRSHTAFFPHGFKGLRRLRKLEDSRAPDCAIGGEDEKVSDRMLSSQPVLSSPNVNNGVLTHPSGSSSMDFVQSLIHLPAESNAECSSTDNNYISSFARHCSTFDVSKDETKPVVSLIMREKSIGTLQRLARSSSNLISRSRSCLTLDSLQKFRKNFSRHDKSVNVPAKKGKLKISEPSDGAISKADSLHSVEMEVSEPVSDRVGSSVEEQITNTSSLSLCSNSKTEAVPSISDIVNDDVNSSLCDSLPLDVRNNCAPSENVMSTPCRKVDSKNNVTQRSKSFHIELSRNTIKRNPSMLYYFNKTPILSKFRKSYNDDAFANNSVNEDVSNAPDHELLNIVTQRKLEGTQPSNLNSPENSSDVIGSKNEIQSPWSGNVVVSKAKCEHSIDVCEPKGVNSLFSEGHFHGPEFVVRSKHAPTEILLSCESVSIQKQKDSRPVLVILVTGEKLLLHCSLLSTSVFQISQRVSEHCGVAASLRPLFGVATLQAGEFLFPPDHTKLCKLLPKGWKNRRNIARGEHEDSLILHYRLLYYHKGVESHSEALCWLVYLQLRQDALQARLPTTPQQQLLYMAALALRVEMPDWLSLYQETNDLLLKYYLPEFLLNKLCPAISSDDFSCARQGFVSDGLVTSCSAPSSSLFALRCYDSTSCTFPEFQAPASLDDICRHNSETSSHCTACQTPVESSLGTSLHSKDSVDSNLSDQAVSLPPRLASSWEQNIAAGPSREEVIRVLVSYESKLRTVSVWGAVRRFIATAQHTAYYGTHYYTLQQHSHCSGPQHFLGVSSSGLLLLPGTPSPSTVLQATVHPWHTVSTIRRWSDGRVRVVVHCERCRQDASLGSRRGLRSCVSALTEHGATSCSTHKITLNAGSGLRSKCMVHVIKAHKKLSQDPVSLAAAVCVDGAQSSGVSTSSSISSLTGSSRSRLPVNVVHRSVDFPNSSGNTYFSPVECLTISGNSSLSLVDGSATSGNSFILPSLTFATESTITGSCSPSAKNSKLLSEVDPSDNTLDVPKSEKCFQTKVLDAADICSEVIDFQKSTDDPPQNNVDPEEERFSTPIIRKENKSQPFNSNDLKINHSGHNLENLCTVNSFTLSNFDKWPSKAFESSSLKSKLEDAKTSSPQLMKAASPYQSIITPIKLPYFTSEQPYTEDPRLSPELCSAPAFKSSFAQELSASSTNLSNKENSKKSNCSKTRALNSSNLPSSKSHSASKSRTAYDALCLRNKLNSQPCGSLSQHELYDLESEKENIGGTALANSRGSTSFHNELVEAISKHFDFSMPVAPATLGEKRVNGYSSNSGGNSLGFGSLENNSGDFSEMLMNSCLRFSEICSDLVESTNQKLQEVLADDFNFSDGNTSFSSSFEKMFEAVNEEDEDIEEKEADPNVSAMKKEKSVTFDLDEEVETLMNGSFNSEDVSFKKNSSGRSKVCVDEMDVDYFLDDRSEKESDENRIKKALKAEQIEENNAELIASCSSSRSLSFEVIHEVDECIGAEADEGLSNNKELGPVSKLSRPSTLPLVSDISRKEFSLHSPHTPSNASSVIVPPSNRGQPGLLKLSPFLSPVLHSNDEEEMTIREWKSFAPESATNSSIIAGQQSISDSIARHHLCHSVSDSADSVRCSNKDNLLDMSNENLTHKKSVFMKLTKNVSCINNSGSLLCNQINCSCKEEQVSTQLKPSTEILPEHFCCASNPHEIHESKSVHLNSERIHLQSEANSFTQCCQSATIRSGALGSPELNSIAPQSPLACSTLRRCYSRSCQSPVLQRLGVTSLSPAHCHDAAGCHSLSDSPLKVVSPSVRMGTRIAASAVVRNRQRSEERLIRPLLPTPVGCQSSGGSLDSLSEEAAGAPLDASWGSSNNSHLGESEGSADTPEEGGCVLVPVLLERGAGGSLGIVVVQGDDSDLDSIDAQEGDGGSNAPVTKDSKALLKENPLLGENSSTARHGSEGSSAMFLNRMANESAGRDGSACYDSLQEDDGIELQHAGSSTTSLGGSKHRTAVLVQTVMEGGAAYNKLIPGDELVWVNGQNLEELPYHVCMELLSDCSVQTLSFVVVRRRADHLLLLARQRPVQARPFRFSNEQTPEEYFRDMRLQQQQQQLLLHQLKAQQHRKLLGGSELKVDVYEEDHCLQIENKHAALKNINSPYKIGSQGQQSLLCQDTAERINQMHSSYHSLDDDSMETESGIRREDIHNDPIKLVPKENTKIQLQVEYALPCSKITVPIVSKENFQPGTNRRIGSQPPDLALPPTFANETVSSIKRSESKEELGSLGDASSGRAVIQRSHTFSSGREVRSGRFTCVTLNHDKPAVDI